MSMRDEAKRALWDCIEAGGDPNEVVDRIVDAAVDEVFERLGRRDTRAPDGSPFGFGGDS